MQRRSNRGEERLTQRVDIRDWSTLLRAADEG